MSTAESSGEGNVQISTYTTVKKYIYEYTTKKVLKLLKGKLNVTEKSEFNVTVVKLQVLSMSLHYLCDIF